MRATLCTPMTHSGMEKNCGPVEETCCNDVQPWFHKVLAYGTTNDIEVRVCCNGNTDTVTKDVALQVYEVYVKQSTTKNLIESWAQLVISYGTNVHVVLTEL